MKIFRAKDETVESVEEGRRELLQYAALMEEVPTKTNNVQFEVFKANYHYYHAERSSQMSTKLTHIVLSYWTADRASGTSKRSARTLGGALHATS